MKTLKIISLIIFIALTVFFGIWAFKSDLSFNEFGVYFGIIGSVASLIGLFISIYTLSKPKQVTPDKQDSLISVKKNVVKNSTLKAKGDINIGDNLSNKKKNK